MFIFRIFLLIGFSSLLIGIPLAQAKDGASPSDDVAKWMSAAATEIMSFGFYNYDERKAENKKYFTDAGHAHFYQAMERARIPEIVRQYQQIVSVELTCMPEVKAPTDEMKAKLTDIDYVAKFPLLVAYTAGARVQKQDLLVTAMLVDRGDGESMSIQQWIALPASEDDIKRCSDQDRKKAEIETLAREVMEKRARMEQLEKELNGK